MAAGAAAAQAEQAVTLAELQPELHEHEARVMSLADEAAARYGMDRLKAFEMAWVAVRSELQGKGRAEDLLREMAEEDDAASLVGKLSKREFHDLLAAIERMEHSEQLESTDAWAYLMNRLVAELARQDAEFQQATYSGQWAGISSSWFAKAQAYSREHEAEMPSVWWLKNASGSILQMEPIAANIPPFGSAGNPHDTIIDEEPQQTPAPEVEEEEQSGKKKTGEEEKQEEKGQLQTAAFTSSFASAAPRLMMRAMAMPFADVPASIEVADGTSQSVMMPTEVYSVTLGSGSTLYVADALTLSHELTVQDDSRLVVKDGGVVQLGTYSDSQSAATNKNVALLFNALLHSTTTEGSGVVKIDSVSVQFGDGSAYNLADAETGLNAVFDARYEIAKDLQLQNYNQGLAHSKNPTQVAASSWQISESGDVHVKGDLKLSSYQQLDVSGGKLVVDGVATLGHTAGSAYAAKLTIADGSYVQLKQIGDARKEQDGKSELVMTGGELVFTADGNVVTNKLGGITLSGGELVADGHSWVLNHNATIGSDEGLSIRTDAAHSVTLGVAGTTTTLAGPVSVSEGSNAVLNGTYAGTGVVELADGASLTLGQNFSTAEGSSVGLSGTGSVQVNWTGTPGSLRDGFMEFYNMNYRPSGLTGALNLDHAEGLVWKDAAGNTLHNVAYEDGVLTGHLAADPTVYHIVTAGHTAVYDAGGNAEGAFAFALYNNGNLFIGNGSGVSAAQVTQNGHTLTLQGSGRYDLGSISKVQDIKLPSNLVLGDDWTGIIKLDGQDKELGVSTASFDTWGLDGDGYRWDSMVKLDAETGKALSWLELDGVKSYFTQNDHTIAANLMLAEGTALNICNGFGTRDITFSGNIAGSGTFENSNAGTAVDKYIFTGDISQWTGQFLKTTGGTAYLTLSGDAHEVNAAINRTGGTLNMSIETDTKLNANVTASDLSITAGKTVEVGRDALVDISNKQYGAESFDSLIDSLTGAGTVKMLGGTYQMGGTAAAGQAHDFKTNYVFTSELTLMDWKGYDAASWNVLSDATATEDQAVKNGSVTVQNGDLWIHNRQTLNIKGGSVMVEKGHLKLGLVEGSTYAAYATMDSGSLAAQGIHFVTGTSSNTINGKATSFTMSGGTLNITGSTFAAEGSATTAKVDISGGTLLADNHAWTLNYNSTIGPVSIVTQGETGAITLGTQGVTTTLTDVVDNRGNLTLDGTVNLTMETSNTAYGFVDAAGHVNYSGVGFDAEITMPGTVYHVISGNAAAMGSNLTWTANGQALTVVAEADKGSAPANALYFDGFNLRPVRDLDNPETQRTGTIYHMGARGDYTMSAADAAIATGIELTGRGGSLHVGTTPANPVSLDLAAGTLVLENGADLTVDKTWAMEAGAAIELSEGSVLTLPGVWGETTPNSYTNSYNVYHLLHNTTGAGKVVFDSSVSWQFGNAGHNTVSTGGYNILDEYGAENGVNADITFDLEVNGDMLIQNYRQGKDHPEVGSQWKVSEGGSLTVHGNFESSSYQKVIVDGGDVAVDGTYKIGHEAGREYEGDLELKSGSLTVGTLETVHEDTSTVHISGGKLTVTKGNAFANTFREVSACDAEFEGTWTWNHDATIGNITVTAGSAITLGTADTTLTLESPLKNHGALTLDGTIKADIEKQEGAWAYGTDALGYTPEGDGYYKRTDDLYTLIAEGNNATLGADIKFILNGQSLKADEFNWDGKAIGMGGTEAGTVYFLNTTNGYTYTDADTRTTAFELVNTGATLRMERDPAALETIHALGGTVSLGSGVRMESSLLNAEATVTMAGEGTYLLSNNALMAHPAAHRVSFGNPAWTGTVQMSGMLGLEGSLNELGNENSWVEMQGVFGADAAPSMDVNVKLTDTAHESAWIYTGDGHDVSFTGDWAGDGTFAFAPVGGASQQLDYSGDLSAWSGAFSAEGGTAQLHFSGAGEKTVAAAMQQQGGRIELTADADTHFTASTQAALYAAEGGDLLADHADAASIDSIRAAGGDVTLKGLAEDTAVSLQALVIGDSRTVTALAEGGDAAEVVLGAGSVLMAGQSATLTAGLTLESDSYISIDDRAQGLRVNGSLSLSQGLEMDDSMLQHLDTHHRLVLFSGVTELTLADGTSTSAALTAWDQTEAADYFRQVLDRLNSEGGQTYYLTYSGAENGGLVCIETPEPATATLSLLALAGLLARRRRK